MIDINELRKVTADCYWPTSPVAIDELLDRLEAAESDGLEQARLLGMSGEREAALLSKLEAAKKERDALLEALKWMVLRTEEGGYPDGKCLEEARAAIARAKVTEMEQECRAMRAMIQGGRLMCWATCAKTSTPSGRPAMNEVCAWKTNKTEGVPA